MNTVNEIEPARSEPTVSVVLATYNRAHFLPQALDSLLNQTRPPDEIIVVNDNSTDDTDDVLKRYGARIRYIPQQVNAGKPAALNHAIPLAEGSHIWLFDDDDVALPDALQTHIDFLSTHPDIDFSYSDKFIFSGGGDIWDKSEWSVSRMPPLPPTEFLIRTMESMNTLMQGMLIPARCYHAVGLFDEALLRCEDHDMVLRLARHFRGGNVGQPTFVYRDHAGMRGADDDAHAASERFAVMLRYRQGIFRQVRAQYPLECYLPGDGQSAGQGVMEGSALTHALLQRSCVMFRHGLADEAIEDLAQGLAHLPETGPAPDWLPRLLSRSLDVEPWMFSDRQRLRKSLNQVLGQYRTRRLGRYLARGLYWNAVRAWKKREWDQAFQSLRMLLAFGALRTSSVAFRRTAR